MSNGTATARRNRSKVARAMDIRTVIGVLLGLYGIILTITGLVKGSDAHADLVSGMCLLVAGAVFLVWVRLRPVKVPEVAEEASESAAGRAKPPRCGPQRYKPCTSDNSSGVPEYFWNATAGLDGRLNILAVSA